MDEELRAKLSRLGVVRGARNLKPVPAADRHLRDQDLVDDNADFVKRDEGLGDSSSWRSELPAGYVAENDAGACYVVDTVYPSRHWHGKSRLADLLARRVDTTVPYAADDRLAHLDFQELLFLDTETTGLAGAGTLAFMVGVAYFEEGASDKPLVVRQFFLRDHDDEPAMLRLLSDLVSSKQGLITFNGRSFDLPLLDARFIMNRIPVVMSEMPHIDLLPLSRRLWRCRIGSCALSSLEKNLLGVHRTHEDIPGWRIPGLYHDFLRTGDASEMSRVFYHNEIDMLSMVTLADHALSLLDGTRGRDQPEDLFSLGKWQASLGLISDSEQNLRSAIREDMPLSTFNEALYELAMLLKRNDRRDEAATVWQQLAAVSFDDIQAYVELAKHFEWHAKDISEAVRWTEGALKLLKGWKSRTKAALAEGELMHRLNRLQRKLPGES